MIMSVITSVPHGDFNFLWKTNSIRLDGKLSFVADWQEWMCKDFTPDGRLRLRTKEAARFRGVWKGTDHVDSDYKLHGSVQSQNISTYAKEYTAVSVKKRRWQDNLDGIYNDWSRQRSKLKLWLRSVGWIFICEDMTCCKKYQVFLRTYLARV